jgi:serine/threonine-protein kinase HipA
LKDVREACAIVFVVPGGIQVKDVREILNVHSLFFGNGDMHVKNWSLIYPDGRTPLLAPAYDYVSTVVYMPNDDTGLTIARTKEFERVDTALLEGMAQRAGVPRGVVRGAARDMVDRINSQWSQLNAPGLLAQRIDDEISAHRNRVPLFSGRTVYPVEGALFQNAAGTRQR